MRHTRGDLLVCRKARAVVRRFDGRAEVSRGHSNPANGTKARTCRDGEDLNSMDGADADKHG